MRFPVNARTLCRQERTTRKWLARWQAKVSMACPLQLGAQASPLTTNPGEQPFIVTGFAGTFGDSGAPVWSPRTGHAVGLLSGVPEFPTFQRTG